MMDTGFIRKAAVFFFAVLCLYLWYMQCIRGGYYLELSRMNRIRLVALPGPRGDIYDRNGALLAGTRMAFDCAAIPQEFEADSGAIDDISRLLNTQPAVLRAAIRNGMTVPFLPVTVKKDIDKETAIAVSERSQGAQGIFIQARSVRFYPNKDIGAHVVGYLGRISEQELPAFSDYGYKNMDFIGRGGLELYYDSYLKGGDGGIQVEVDSRGRQLKQLGVKEPESGKDLTTTIDLELEKQVSSLLDGHAGAAAVMNSDTGEILALVSKPDFDPNVFVSSADAGLVGGLLKRADCPMLNRAVSGAYPPGSVFKIVTGSAGLELKKISPSEKLACHGFYTLGNWRFDCWKEAGHGAQFITGGIKNSCNVFFYQLGRRIGVDGLANYAARYGMGRVSRIDLPYEATGIVPTKTWKIYRMRQGWFDGDTINYAIGQGYLLVTPIQVLRMVNCIAADGALVQPFLVKNIDSLEIGSQRLRRIEISKDTINIIKEGMKKAVEEPGGTARAAAAEGLNIFGKTGTAQAGPKGTHAWFAGFGCTEKAKFSVVVFLEYGGKGGDKPAKIAGDIFAKLKELNYL